MGGKRIAVQSAPISHIKRVVEPIGQKDASDIRINPATEDTILTQADFAFDQVTIGTTEVRLIAASTPCIKGVLIKALSTNTGIIYIGKIGVSVTTGYELTAGESVTIEVDNVNKLYGIASAFNQVVSWIGV